MKHLLASALILLSTSACDFRSSSLIETDSLAQGLSSTCPTGFSITGSLPNIQSTIDGSTSTGVSASGSQSVTIDLGCTVTINTIRRHMTGSGGSRGIGNSEAFEVSKDGVTWVNVLNESDASYGWTEDLQPTTKIARHVRFTWDANSDSLNEIEVVATAWSTTGNLPQASLVTDGDVGTKVDVPVAYSPGYVVIDLGEEVFLTSVERFIEDPLFPGFVRATTLEEEYATSLDGTTFDEIRYNDLSATAQLYYVNKASGVPPASVPSTNPSVWAGLLGAWDVPLQLRQPRRVRFLRVETDLASYETFHEVTVTVDSAGSDPNYDFDLADPVFDASFQSSVPVGPFPSDPLSDVGMTGTFFAKVHRPSDDIPVQLTLRDNGTEVRGTMLVARDGLNLAFGGSCGTQDVPAGAVFDVRMGVQADGTFCGSGTYVPIDDGMGVTYLCGPDFFPCAGCFTSNYLTHAEGSTTRKVKKFLFSSDVVTTFRMTSRLSPHWFRGPLSFGGSPYTFAGQELVSRTLLSGDVSITTSCGTVSLQMSGYRMDSAIYETLGFTPTLPSIYTWAWPGFDIY